MQEHELTRHVRALLDASLIVEQSDGQFAFRHALVHDAVYSAMLLRERRLLHGLAATAMESVYAGALDLHAPELAYQFYEAGAWDKALAYGTRAGEKAQSMYALHEALAHYTHALDAARHLDATPAGGLWRARASVYDMLGAFDDARADYEQALAVARAQSDARAEWQLLLDLGLLWQSRDFERTGEYAQQALALARRLGDPAALAHTLNRLGNWHMNRDEPFEARRYHREALGVFEGLNDRRGIALTLEQLGVSQYSCSDAFEGAACCERAMRMFGELDDRQGLLHSTMHLMLPSTLDTEVTDPLDLPRLLALAESALRMAGQMGWRAGEAEARTILAEVLGPHGQYAHALRAARRAQALAEETGHRAGLGMSSNVLGGIYLDLLAVDEAQQMLERGLAASRESGSTMFVNAMLPVLALAYLLQGKPALAESAVLPTLAVGVEQSSRQQRLGWYARAELALAGGDAALTLQIAERLIASAPHVETRGPYAIPKLSRLHAQALVALGRLDEAERELCAALAVARAQGRLPLQWRIQLSLGRLYRRLGLPADAERELAQARAIVESLARDVPEESLRATFRARALALFPAPAAAGA